MGASEHRQRRGPCWSLETHREWGEQGSSGRCHEVWVGLKLRMQASVENQKGIQEETFCRQVGHSALRMPLEIWGIGTNLLIYQNP